MGLFDCFKSRKKKKEDAAGSGQDSPLMLDDVDLSGIEPPETRYTEEYKEFLAEMEAADDDGDPPPEAE